MDSPTIETESLPLKSFKSDYRLLMLSSLGLIGFVFANLLFFPPDFSKKPLSNGVFHEILYQPRDIVKQIVESELSQVNQQIILRNDSIGIFSNQKDELAKARLKELGLLNKEDSSRIKKYSDYDRLWNGISKSDTVAFVALNKALHFDITQDALNAWDTKKASVIDVKTSFIDLAIPIKSDTTVKLTAFPYLRNIDFLTRYPVFGGWLLLIFVFSSFCLIAISTCLYLTQKRVRLFKNNNVTGHLAIDYYVATAVLVGILILLAKIWENTFYDNEVIKDLYFMETLNNKLDWIVYLGLIAGAFCLAGFIHSGVLLGYFAKELKKSNQTQDLNMKLSRKDASLPSVEEIQVIKEEQEKHRDKIIYLGLSNAFQSYFILSAVLLSLMVFTTGLLYSAVNSLSFIKLITDDWGHSPARSEFVYLYGALYTIILLLIYVPVRIRLTEFDTSSDPQSVVQGNWKNFGKSMFDQLKGVLIAVSPLLTSLVQALLDLLFN